MKTFVLAGVGLPGAMLVALAARTKRTSHETPSKAVHPARLCTELTSTGTVTTPKTNRTK